MKSMEEIAMNKKTQRMVAFATLFLAVLFPLALMMRKVYGG